MATTNQTQTITIHESVGKQIAIFVVAGAVLLIVAATGEPGYKFALALVIIALIYTLLSSNGTAAIQQLNTVLKGG